MTKIETAIFTNMCMILDNAENVLVQKRSHSNWPGITFPGGHAKAGESFVDAAIREVYEETGLVVSNLRLCGMKDWVQDDGTRYIVLLYKTTVFQGELVSSSEGEVWWTPLKDLSVMKLSDGMETILKIFCEDELSEQFVYKENGEWFEVLK